MYRDPEAAERGVGYLAAFIYSIVVALIWLPVAALRRAARLLREFGVESWPRTDGSITSGNVKVIHGWILDYALGRLDYSYRVAGEYYAGAIVGQYPDEQAAWDFVDAYRDRPVVVRYKDNKPEVSVLRDADQDLPWTGTGPGKDFFTMIWQHWRDELRGEQQPLADEEDSPTDKPFHRRRRALGPLRSTAHPSRFA